MSTLLGILITAFLQGRSARSLRVLDAKIVVFADCAAALYEFERATFNRVQARIDARPDAERAMVRQEAFRLNSQAKAAIGRVAMVSSREDAHIPFERARELIGELNQVASHSALRARHDAIEQELGRVFAAARSELR